MSEIPSMKRDGTMEVTAQVNKACMGELRGINQYGVVVIYFGVTRLIGGASHKYQWGIIQKWWVSVSAPLITQINIA